MEPPIDPVINGDDNNAIAQDYTGYQYFHEPIYHGDDHQGHHSHGVGMYEDNYPEERKSEGPIITNCPRFDEEISSYVPSAALPKDQPYYRKYRETDGSRGYYPDLPTV
jgi:meiosis-specific transcription factor NDT80